MKRDEDLTMLRECYRMGHGIDFCWGRSLVIEDCADIPLNALKKLCAFWKANLNEVQQGIDYQRAIFRAAALLVGNAGSGNTGNTKNTTKSASGEGAAREIGVMG